MQKTIGDETPNAVNEAGTFQFSLMALFVITTLTAILLAVAKIWPAAQAFFIIVVTLALAEWVYRKRLKVVLGARNYEKAAWTFERLCGAVSGAMLGGVLGVVFLVIVFNVFSINSGWSFVKIGILWGTVLGLFFPRAANTIVGFLSFLPLP